MITLRQRIVRFLLLVFLCSVSLIQLSEGRILPEFLMFLMEQLVAKNLAAFEPPKQDRSVVLYWRTPEEWGEVLHEWVIISLSIP